MHPIEIIEFMIAGSIIGTIAIVSLFLKGKLRKVGWVSAAGVLVASCIFFVVRPYWIDAQIEKKVGQVNIYLEQHYPDEEWEISTVPYRVDGYESQNPYYIMVVFDNEPDVIYHYWVGNKREIYRMSYTSDKNMEEFKHMENDIE